MTALDYKLVEPVAAPQGARPPGPSLFDDADFVRSFYSRLHELQTSAMEANEPVSLASAAELLAFLAQIPFTRRPGLFLLDNGNFRLVWRTPDNEQAAFQFRGDSIVHCVFFYKRGSQVLPLSRETVVDLVANVVARRADFAHVLGVPERAAP